MQVGQGHDRVVQLPEIPLPDEPATAHIRVFNPQPSTAPRHADRHVTSAGLLHTSSELERNWERARAHVPDYMAESDPEADSSMSMLVNWVTSMVQLRAHHEVRDPLVTCCEHVCVNAWDVSTRMHAFPRTIDS